MPIILVNHSPFDLIIQPYIGVVQLCLVNLSQAPQHPYGSNAALSKYIDDDGGPSRYWLDQSITELRSNTNAKKADESTQQFLEQYFSELDEPTRKRFGKRVERAGASTDTDVLVDQFVKAERVRSTAIPVGTILLSVPLAILTSWLPAMWGAGLSARAAIGVITFATVAGFGWIAWTQWGTTIAPYELKRIATALKRVADHKPL